MPYKITLPDPKTTSAYDLLISPENFRLAWERVRYFDRPDSRDWIGLKVFAANRDHNLEVLQQSVIQKTFVPSPPEIKYFPKASQTLRPMAVLAIKDRVVFQAIANVIAEKGRSTLSIIANRQSFANVLQGPDKIPMFNHWKQQNYIFQKRFSDLFEEGNLWLAETDIAAFYEMIDHKRLFEILQKDVFLDEQVLSYLEAYLPVWASIKRENKASRGVPQGCLSSDLLAGVFLHELDEMLSSHECHYLRYVDDIRLLSDKKEAVQRGLIQIDITLKSIGLILQTNKTTLRRIEDIDKERDHLTAQLSDLDRRLKDPEYDFIIGQTSDPLLNPTLQQVAQRQENFNNETASPGNRSSVQSALLKLFWQSMKTLDMDPFAERHLRFCLWRLDPHPDVVIAILPYLTERPWLGEMICIFLKRCNPAKKVVDSLVELVERYEVYDSIATLALETLIEWDVSLRHLHGLFKKWLVEGKRDWPLLSTAAVALGKSPDNLSTLLKVVNNFNANPFTRRMAMIQASKLARDTTEATHVLKAGIIDNNPIMIDTALHLLYAEWGLTLSQITIRREEQLSEYCVASAKGYDNSLPDVQQDYIRHIFYMEYEVQFSQPVDFQNLLGSDYKRGADFLWQAQISFFTNPSRYVSQLDLFHEELLFPILVDKVKWKNSKAELVKVALPDRMTQLTKNKNNLTVFVGALLDCHHLRSSCTEAHTRLHGVMDVTNPVSWRQRNALKKKLYAGYQELTDWLIAGCP